MSYRELYSKNKQMFNTIYRVDELKFVFEIYCKYFFDQFPELKQEEVLKSVEYYNACYIPFFERNEESVKKYMNDNLFFNKNIVDVILSIGNENKRLETSLYKVLHDLDLSWLKDYDSLINQQQKILKECLIFGIENPQEKMIEFYKKMLGSKDIYLTKTFNCFNEIAKENIMMRLT